MNPKELILYRDFEEGALLEKMWRLMDACIKKNMDGMEEDAFEAAHILTELAGSHGFTGNVWHDYLAYVLANHENAFSLACEINGPVKGSVNAMALHDFGIFKKWFDFDLKKLDTALSMPLFGILSDYEASSGQSKIYNSRIRDDILKLARELKEGKSPEEYLERVARFYKEFGVGKFGLHKAFRIEGEGENVQIVPITKTEHIYLRDLIGYDIQKKKLIENTEAFIQGKKANNCLLFGDSGTGKSSSIKAVLNEYYGRGLRMIEVYKHQFRDLSKIIARIKNRNYKFIIYMDDLSFEDFEIEYKYLKAIIEGGLERRPDNVLIYATSNRRHLIREHFSDKEETRQDMHTSDTVQEKLSLVARFGVTIYYGAPGRTQFQDIVLSLAKRVGLKMEKEELLAEANKWELHHGGLSGRTAAQFITYLMGKQE